MKKLVAPDAARLAASVILPLLAGFIGSFFTRGSVDTWYLTLKKSSLNPPGSVFAPVWTALYVLMGVSLFLVWRQGASDPRVRLGMGIFAVQLILNTLWSIAFFGARSPLAGAVVIVALWIAILANLVVFAKVSRWAGALLVPYLLWVTFASFLNFSIYFLNR